MSGGAQDAMSCVAGEEHNGIGLEDLVLRVYLFAGRFEMVANRWVSRWLNRGLNRLATRMKAFT